jgi:1-deoxy-D-xylulose-5-phosphate reductoisomerase
MKKIALLGATGSIGKSTREIVRHYQEDFQIVGVAARRNVEEMVCVMEEFNPPFVAMFDHDAAAKLQPRLKGDQRVLEGLEGIVEVACESGADLVVSAIVGASGLLPTLEAIRRKKNIAIANKEVLVMAGGLVTSEAKRHGVKLLPVDSEHSALYQCLDNRPSNEVKRLMLTASGGPFLRKSAEELKHVTVEEALKHPTWDMGPKITVDSATLMNKGLEVLEAMWLFDVAPEKIDILVHPQSIVHSCVEFVDGSVMAQMNDNDMKIPIQYALSWPKRLPNIARDLDLTKVGTLQFESPDPKRFPAIRLAYEVARMGPTAAAVMNAANEVAVEAFLNKRIAFDRIVPLVEGVLEKHRVIAQPTLQDILEVDRWARASTLGSGLALSHF